MSLKELILNLRRFVWRTLRRPGPPPGITLEYASNLFDRGDEFNNRGMHREALQIAQQLASYRHTGAWEIEAVALYGLGEVEHAIESLRKGIEKMPFGATAICSVSICRKKGDTRRRCKLSMPAWKCLNLGPRRLHIIGQSHSTGQVAQMKPSGFYRTQFLPPRCRMSPKP